MKKKLLISAVAASVALSAMGALVACGDDADQNAELAQSAIATVRNLYADKAQETPIDYSVIGRVNVGGEYYTINWSVSSSVENFGNYVVVGEPDESTNVTIHITQTDVEVAYTLTASVTIGESTETADFARKIPAAAPQHAGTEADPYVVANVREIGAGLGSGKYYEVDGEAKQIYVKGYVVDPGTAHSSGTRINNAYLVDEYAADKDKDSEGALNIYTLSYDDTVFTGQYPLRHGDLVVLTGFIQNYNGTIEITYKGSVSVTCVSLTAAPDNRTADEKAQAAVDAVALTTSKFTAAGDVTLPESSVAGVTLTWAEKEDSQYVSIADNVLTVVADLPETETPITLTVTATIDGVSKTKDVTIKVQKEDDLGLEHAGTQADPFSLADVNKIFATLSESTSYQVNGVDKEVFIEGYVTVGGTVGTYRLDNVYIADVAGTAQADSVLVYGIDWDEEKLPEGTTLTVGDKILIKGYLKDYRGTKEVAQTGSGATATYPKLVELHEATDERTDEQKVDAALAALTLGDTYNTSCDVTLPVSTVRGVTITWTSNNAAAVIASDNSKMTVTIPETSSAAVTVTASATCGEVTKTRNFNITLSKATAPVAGTYRLAMERGTNPTLYFTGEMSGYYGATTTSIVNGADIVLTKSGDDYTLRIGTDGKYIEVSKNDTHINFTLADSPSATKWQFNSTYGILTWKIDEEEYWIGTNGTYTTVGAYSVDKLTGSDAAKQYPVKFVTYNPSESTDAEKVELALGALSATLANIETIGETTLPASSVDGVTFTWALASDNTATNVFVAGNKLTVSALPTNDDATVKLVVTANCGEVSTNNTKTVTVKVVAPANYGTSANPISVTDALAIAEKQCQRNGNWTNEVVYMTGKVTVVNGKNLTLADVNDASKTIIVYDGTLGAGVTASAPNDVLVVSGYITRYKYGDTNGTGTDGTIEFSKKDTTVVTILRQTIGTSTITVNITKDDEENNTATVTGIPETATNGTEVTFTVVPVTGRTITAVKVGTKALTAAADGNYSFTVAGNMTVTVETIDVTAPPTVVTWTKVTAASQLHAGDVILLTNGTNAIGTNEKADGSGTYNYFTRLASGVTMEEDQVKAVSDDAVTITLEDAGDGKFYLKVGDKYLYGPSGASSKNELYLGDKQTDGSRVWEITTDDSGNIVIKSTVTSKYSGADAYRTIQYNSNSGQERFSCYASAQQSLTIYLRVETPESGD